uniref:Uncharacterized protein n=1 Tax=Acrobeloides nanus TaxID=290746 RepID=A0A914D985_9BILA
MWLAGRAPIHDQFLRFDGGPGNFSTRKHYRVSVVCHLHNGQNCCLPLYFVHCDLCQYNLTSLSKFA